MEPKLSTHGVQIDLKTWERAPLFELFSSFSEPYHGVCLRVDCTETFRFAKDSRISVFLALLHRSLTAAHQVENFMTRIVDGSVWRYSTIHGGSAVGRPNGTIGFGRYLYRPELVVSRRRLRSNWSGLRRETISNGIQDRTRFDTRCCRGLTSHRLATPGTWVNRTLRQRLPSAKSPKRMAGARCQCLFMCTMHSRMVCMWLSLSDSSNAI
jgi:hypothetical protein